MKINRKRWVPVFLLTTSLILTTTLFYIFAVVPKERINDTDSKKSIGSQTVNTEKPKIVSCTRTTRLDNEPQYDRALSLIQQRISERNKIFANQPKYQNILFTHFLPELVNCIKVTEATPKGLGGVEGYFTFNSKDIKADYYPITVSSDYSFTDDIVNALLLTHEMTHVQQYIDSLNGKSALSCIDREVDAFVAQIDFYPLLNSEENNSVYQRMQNDKSLDSQIQMIKEMISINQESGCDFLDWNCSKANLCSKLREILVNDSYYKKECGL